MNEQLKIIISAEIDKLKKGVKEAQGVLGTFKSEIAKNKKEIEEAWKTMGEGATTASKAILGGVTAVGTAFLALGASTQEYRNEQAKLTTAFEAAGSSAEQASDTYNDLFRVLGDSGQATEAANHLAKITTEEKALSEWTNICQGVYATFGDSLPIEGLTEAANETAKVGTVTGSLADALNWAGVSEDAFNEKLAATNSEAEREQLIRETLNGLYSDAAAKYEENNAQVLAQNEAQAKLQETTAKLGEVVAPVVTAFTQFATDALAVVVPYVQQLAEQYLPILQEVLANMSAALAPIAEFIVNNLPLIAGIAGTILAIAAAYQVVTGALAAYNAIKAAYTLVTTVATAAQTAFAAANLAALAPILAVVAAIGLIIAVLVKVYKESETFRKIVDSVWAFVKKLVAQAVENVIERFNHMRQKIADYLNMVKTIVSTIFNAVVSTIVNKIETAKNVVQNVVALIKAIFSGDLGAAKNAVANIFSALVNSIKTKLETAKNTVKSIISAIVGFFTGAKFSWPKIPMPHFAISPSGWKAADLFKGSIPKLSINWYAEGGVFDKPTLFYGNGGLSGLGENGAEAVVPLEKNTQWLDRLASMLNERMGGKQPIVLTVDGKVFAQTAINTINQQTRQTGKLALNLV